MNTRTSKAYDTSRHYPSEEPFDRDLYFQPSRPEPMQKKQIEYTAEQRFHANAKTFSKGPEVKPDKGLCLTFEETIKTQSFHAFI